MRVELLRRIRAILARTSEPAFNCGSRAHGMGLPCTPCAQRRLNWWLNQLGLRPSSGPKSD